MIRIPFIPYAPFYGAELMSIGSRFGPLPRGLSKSAACGARLRLGEFWELSAKLTKGVIKSFPYGFVNKSTNAHKIFIHLTVGKSDNAQIVSI